MNDQAIPETTTNESAETEERITELTETVATLKAELEAARGAGESAATEALELRERLEAAQVQVREAAGKYREARLAAAPDVPPDLVPESGEIADIDRSLEAALRLATHVRERVQQETQAEGNAAVRIPAGAPQRRAPDMSSMSAAEKIRVGLERLSDTNRR